MPRCLGLGEDDLNLTISQRDLWDLSGTRNLPQLISGHFLVFGVLSAS